MPAPPAFPFTTFQEAWFWNGFALNQPYWNISSFGGSRNNVPTLRGADIQVPYRAGQSWRPKYPDERTIALTMWLSGDQSATSGFPAADARLAFNDNWQALRNQFFTRSALGHVQGQLQRSYYRTQGTPKLVVSTAMAELAGSMDLTMNGRFGAAFTVDLLLSDPYFYGTLATQAINPSGGTITNLGEGVAGEGFPSAVHGFTVTCTAATTVTNTTAGVSFTISAGPTFPVVVDQLNGTVTDNAGVNRIANFSHVGSRLWMCLLNGANVIANTAGTATFAYNPPYV